MPMGSILLRAFVFYLGFSILMLLAYRRYRDWLHDDGWKMAESYARHERLAELQRLRQEMNERIQEARAAAAGSHDRIESLRNPIIRPFSSEGVTDYNAVTTSKERELRALERVRRQRIEDKMMVKGWPSIPDEKGKLVVQAQYPPGVVFFEPHRTDDRLRQVANLHEGRARSESLQKEREAAGVGGEGGGAAVAEVIQVILNSVREEKS
ncbi:unnamed protein product [Trypanosoma congolense IL3000]|uniref:WGS project CAEQ00000000 data, annotated contig 1962 n=1 Tax=Trypanosoma congolense (strain IL3000) TaxID=1068625 RepID=F9WAE3_TRYCI|nr:unnamed protein product [Trypanosoma congolense IL3000]